MVPGHHASPRRGFALIAALWLVIAIAAVALEFSLHEREGRMTAVNVAEQTQAYAAASAGIATTQSRLVRLLEGISSGSGDRFASTIDSTDPWQRADSLFSGTERVGNAAYTVTVRDAGSVLNINVLDEDMWRSLLTAVGEDYDTADRLAQSIMDWSDPDNDPHPRGAEQPQYLQAGRLVLPTNKRFVDVAQLRDVLGMTPAIYARIAPYLTVNAWESVNVKNADPVVLRTLPGFTDDVVAEVLEKRNSGSQTCQSLSQGLPKAARQSLAGDLTTCQTEALTIHSVGWAPGHHTHVVSDAVLVRRKNQTQTVWRKDK